MHRTKIELTGFDDHEVRALVREPCRRRRSTRWSTSRPRLARGHGGGNPFFLRELLRELDEHLVKLDDAAE